LSHFEILKGIKIIISSLYNASLALSSLLTA